MANLALLRVAPLLSATSYVTFTFCEDTFIRPLVHNEPSKTELRKNANRVLPGFISRFTRRGLPFIFLSYPISIATAAANLANTQPSVTFDVNGSFQARAAAALYLAGLIFSVLHFPFGPTAMSYLNPVAAARGDEDDLQTDNTSKMTKWLKLNAIRGIAADLPSWASYFAAFLLAMS
ncbi:hypothetical protein NPX13_g7420 [Xylaria arbuscula]|uniref:Integral membrane protein n=1 Tax=Xylaria arbuscula TaxID=114810 RepID=A0A9W8NAR1_9PEZI|nr:hypothetical protein NPX13_g7420 [Xylaria arbuscula]